MVALSLNLICCELARMICRAPLGSLPFHASHTVPRPPAEDFLLCLDDFCEKHLSHWVSSLLVAKNDPWQRPMLLPSGGWGTVRQIDGVTCRIVPGYSTGTDQTFFKIDIEYASDEPAEAA